MAEYIGCRNCESPDCKGCNLKNLETMLNNGKFDCMMNANRCINPSADVAPVRHGRWIAKNGRIVCSECDAIIAVAPNNDMQQEILAPIEKEERFCYNCGANMDGGDGNA